VSDPASSPPTATGDRPPILALAAIIAATWWAYWPCLWGGLVWDDNLYLRENALLQDGTGLWRIWFDLQATQQYHPLVFSTFWIEYRLWGLDTFGYHIVNVSLHCANSLFLWLLLRRLQVAGALLAAGLFALHPVHVESVAWIAERKDVLSAFFYGLTLLAWLRHLETADARSWWGCLLFAVLTLLSKTVLCTLPVAMALLAWWKAPDRWRSWGAALLPFLALSSVMAGITVWREHSHGNAPLEYSLLERGLIAGRALWTYVATLIWPMNLTVLYEPWEVNAAAPAAYLPPLAVLAVVVGLVLWRQRLGAGVLVAVLLFLFTLSPMLGLIDFNIMRFAFVADHFVYVASAPLLALFAAGAHGWAQRFPREQRNTAAALLLFLPAALTWWQAGLWANPETLWRDNIAKNPRSWMGYNNLAGVLAREGRLDEAITALRQSVAINPRYVGAYNHLGIVLASQGKGEDAIAAFQAAMKIDPTRADVANNLGTLLMTAGRVEEAAEAFEAAIKANPAYPEAWRHSAIAAARLGQRDAAVHRLQEALRLRPDFAAARSDLARLEGRP
jgi:tetratricopeptide (TPR) repeat protein